MQHGELFANIEDRTIRGLLIPYGEASRTNLTGTDPIMFSRGTITVPRDVTMVGLNNQHDRFTWAGRAAQLEETDEGWVATFGIAETDEGDDALAAVQSGRLSKLSAEVVDLVRDGVNAVRARLTGAALVTEGAFASAALFALADPDEDEPTEDSPEPEESEADESAEEEEEAVADATVPTGLPAPTPVVVVEKQKSKGEMFAAIEAVYRGNASRETVQDVRDFFAGQALFALTDITYDGASGLAPTMNPNPQWIGEVGGKPYIQRFVPLFGSKALTALNLGGFTWTGDAGGTWTGNKTPIPSTAPTVAPINDTATRWANGNDIAREHRDFNTPGFFESYNAWNRRGFDKWLDLTITLTEAVAGATDITADAVGAGESAALSAVIDGAAAIVDAGLTPTAAVMDTALWKTIAKIPQSDVLGYLNAQLSLTGDSGIDSFAIVPAPVGTVTAGHVLVVSRDAADVYTLPGSPIRAEAANIANGGLDVGFFGYGALFINDPEGIVDVAPGVAARSGSSK
jgi:hypothetical protein